MLFKSGEGKEMNHKVNLPIETTDSPLKFAIKRTDSVYLQQLKNRKP